ncbi:delta-60 repeat domain-containing protein [Hymenobacter frigidus]|uniref:Delta-60 repeat domain-containing protein n=1 Tax=Hymenobacter frigidus TaxID=1524095 RepID=A0ABQ1ZVA9_9BACT|nr:T9SS type A sorting domain-containing protein [Hymenobacter frigidus]GGH80245.1 delta-60 repeat domain-containing protein [Hymenobacter frigidus]
MKKLLLLTAGLGLAAAPTPGHRAAAQVALDPTFAPNAVYAPGGVFSIVEQPNGQRVVSGIYGRVNGTAATSLSRFSPTGILDAAFQQNVGAASGAFRVRLLANGQLLLTSSFGALTVGGLTRETLLRVNPDGTADTTFNPGTGPVSGSFTGFVDDFLPLPNGQLIAGGLFDAFNGTPAGGLVRLTATGAVDPTFSAGLGVGQNGDVEAIVALPNGQLLVGGDFDTYNGVACNGLVRVNPNGTLDPTFTAGLSPNSEVTNLVVQPNGSILAAGDLEIAGTVDGRGIVRLLPTGTLDQGFTPPAGLTAGTVAARYVGDAMQLQPDGKIVFLSRSGPGVSGYGRVARLNPNGTLDPTFQAGPGPDSRPRTITLLANGNVLTGGSFTDFNGTYDRSLVELTSAGALNPTFQPVLQINGSVASVVRQPDGKLLAGGNFSEINGQPVRRLARFLASGAPDASFAAGNALAASVVALALQPDGRVLMATTFGVQRLLTTGGADNSFTTFNIFSPTSLVLQPDGRVLVAGNQPLSNGAPLIRLLPDGSPDASFAPATSSGGARLRRVAALALQPDGRVLAAGTVQPGGGQADVATVQRLSATGAVDPSFVGLAFDNITFSPFSAVALQPDGKLLVAGNFGGYGGTPRPNLLRLNPNGALDAGFVPPTITGFVSTVLVQPNSRVLLGGSFTGAGLPANLARLLATGPADASFGPTAVPNGSVRALLVQPNGAIVVGGSFSTLGGLSAQALARITAPNVLAMRAPGAVAARTEVWPVPARTNLTVAPDASARPQALDLLDLLGRTVRHQALTSAAPVTLPVADLPAGTYLLRVSYAEGFVARRIQVQ